MMNKKVKISALVLTLCIGASVFTSCGGNKDTTHDAGSDGQVVTTTQKTEAKTEEKTEAKTESKKERKNNNGMIGEAVTDVARGARDIVGGVAEGARDITGGIANGARDMMGGTQNKAKTNTTSGDTMNGNNMNGNNIKNGTNNTAGNSAPKTRTIPNGK